MTKQQRAAQRTGWANTVHGEGRPGRQSAEYKAWTGMKTRCFNKNTNRWKFYGGRGITVCRRWRENYLAFLSDMGRKPTPKHTLDRINNDGDYTPENCRWATYTEQWDNRRKNGERIRARSI